MSRFQHNLPILRRRAGYTQERLAEELGVSRQAVGKWESGQSLPEAATLLTLAQLLSCTLDELMREELEESSQEEPTSGMASAPVEESGKDETVYEQYQSQMARFALMMALGVSLVLAGISSLLLFYVWLGETGLIVLPLLLCVAAAVFLFVFGAMDHEDFMRQFPVIPDCRDWEEERRFRRVFAAGLSTAIAAIVADVAVLVALCVFFEGNERLQVLTVAGFFLILAWAVGAIVFLGVLSERYDLEDYAKEAAKLARPGGPAASSPAAGHDSSLDGDEEKNEHWSALIMSAATILFLLAGFLFQAWHPAWVLFPVAALLSGMVEHWSKLKKK